MTIVLLGTQIDKNRSIPVAFWVLMITGRLNSDPKNRNPGSVLNTFRTLPEFDRFPLHGNLRLIATEH